MRFTQIDLKLSVIVEVCNHLCISFEVEQSYANGHEYDSSFDLLEKSVNVKTVV